MELGSVTFGLNREHLLSGHQNICPILKSMKADHTENRDWSKIYTQTCL